MMRLGNGFGGEIRRETELLVQIEYVLLTVSPIHYIPDISLSLFFFLALSEETIPPRLLKVLLRAANKSLNRLPKKTG